MIKLACFIGAWSTWQPGKPGRKLLSPDPFDPSTPFISGSARFANTGLGVYPHLRMSDVTRILLAIEQGDPQAAGQLLPLVYEELRKLAAQKLAQEKPGQTLQATALVHEAYLRLVGGEGEAHWNSRAHFFGAAAEAMRRILVEQAREKGSLKRGGDWERIEIDRLDTAAPQRPDEVLALHEALTKLATTDPQAAELVKFRYFVGFTVEEAAQALGISARSADFLWAYARTWLLKELQS